MRAGMRRRIGKCFSRASGSGRRLSGALVASAGPMKRLWAKIWKPWVMRVGNVRRAWTLWRCASSVSRFASGAAGDERCDEGGDESCDEGGDESCDSGCARALAAATASWMARLMPTPPMGDMAWAESPMQRRPGRDQWRRRSTATERSLMSRQSFSSAVRPWRKGATDSRSWRKAGRPFCWMAGNAPLGIT